MSTFTLAISSLTTSSLPWFMDLTFQVPMKYHSLQYQTLLPSPITSTTGCYFNFVSFSSFFLELFLHFSPVVYWAPTDLVSPTLTTGLLPIAPTISQLFSQDHKQRSTKSRSQDCSNCVLEVTVWAMEAVQILIWTNCHKYMPTKSTAAKARPISASGALICSDVSHALSLQSQQQGVWIHDFHSHKESFQLSPPLPPL